MFKEDAMDAGEALIRLRMSTRRKFDAKYQREAAIFRCTCRNKQKRTFKLTNIRNISSVVSNADIGIWRYKFYVGYLTWQSLCFK